MNKQELEVCKQILDVNLMGYTEEKLITMDSKFVIWECDFNPSFATAIGINRHGSLAWLGSDEYQYVTNEIKLKYGNDFPLESFDVVSISPYLEEREQEIADHFAEIGDQWSEK
jgi:hypothetical protein